MTGKSNPRLAGANPSFTLMELLLVIGLFLVVSAVTAPALVSFLAQGYLTNSTERIVRTLRTAQSYSLSGKESSSWGIHYEPGKLVLFKGTDYATRDSAFDTETSLPSALTVTGWNDIYFDRLRGLPSNTLNIIVESLGRSRTIAVNGEGAVERP